MPHWKKYHDDEGFEFEKKEDGPPEEDGIDEKFSNMTEEELRALFREMTKDDPITPKELLQNIIDSKAEAKEQDEAKNTGGDGEESDKVTSSEVSDVQKGLTERYQKKLEEYEV